MDPDEEQEEYMFLVRTAKRLYNRLRRIKQRKNEIQPRHHMSKIDINGTTADRRRQGFSSWDSFCYELKYNDYRNYISTWEAWQPERSKSAYFKISADKYLFACVFGPYIKVPLTYALIEKGKLVEINCQCAELYDYILKRGGAAIKDRFGYNGYNVIVLRAKDDGLYHRDKRLTEEDLSNIIKSYSSGIIQERICQGQFENSIFNEAVNTIRIISARRNDSLEHEVIGAVHRFATKTSAPIDNFHQGGVSALIDIETGQMGKLAAMFDTDEKGRHIFRSCHPDTGALIEGIVIPNWKQLKNRVVELTRILPFFEFIAWDFVLQNDGFALIEINKKSALGVFQIHGGSRHTLIGEKYREHGYLVEKWDKNV